MNAEHTPAGAISGAKILAWLESSQQRVALAQENLGDGGQNFWDGIVWADSVLRQKIADGDFDE